MSLRRHTDTAAALPARRNRWRRGAAVVIALLVVCGGVWVVVDKRENASLSRESRVVVRFPQAVIDRLTRDEIHEEFSVQEQAETVRITGTATATGHVSIEIEPPQQAGPDAVIVVHVDGNTDDHLVGLRSGIEIDGTGRGTFAAEKQILFDGRAFEAAGPTRVDASHETEIDAVKPLNVSLLGGAMKLLASRQARQAVPLLNELAVTRIKQKLQQRVDEMVSKTIQNLNGINRFDETVARLHPDSEDWRVRVSTGDGFVQAALVPEGAAVPVLPQNPPNVLEVWMRLSRTQRAGMNLLDQWHLAHHLYRRILPEEQARLLKDDIAVSAVGDWTRLRVGVQASGA